MIFPRQQRAFDALLTAISLPKRFIADKDPGAFHPIEIYVYSKGGGLMAKLVDNPKLAFRLARAIVSDIALYNQDKVKEGIKNDSIFEVLTEELQEGRDHFYGRVSPDLDDRAHLYDRAIVDVMIKQAGKIESSIW